MNERIKAQSPTESLTPQQALEKYFGFSTFREGQETAIQRTLQGQHTLLVMPTGSGKSLAYQLPALLKPGLTLVISPLIALMKDQVDQLIERGIAATYLNSSLPTADVNQRSRAVLEGDIKLLYIAPERLRSRSFTKMLANTQVSLLAVDEAHCISQWGHDFRPDYLQVGPTWQALGRPTLLATTATATPAVQKDILKLLDVPQAQAIVTGFNRPNLTFRAEHTPTDQAKLKQLKVLLKDCQGSVIVYAATRRKTEEVTEFIRHELGLPVDGYHGGLPHDLRDRVQNNFMAGRLKVVVATNAFGMGVDKADVRQVIHYNLPATVEAYYQEAGRAGRDGQPAECLLMIGPDDLRLQEWLIDSDTPAYEDLHQIYDLLSNAANDGEVHLTLQELAVSSQMYPVKIRVTLNELELAGVIYHLGNQGSYSSWKILPLESHALEKRTAAIQKRAEIRHDLLGKMLNYAYTTTCRRKYLLDYFGDVSPSKAPRCCDNHQTTDLDQLPKAVTPQDWLPLIVLETVRSLKHHSVGRIRLAQILNGSQSSKVQQFGHDRHRFYGKLSQLSQKQLLQLIDGLLQARYLQLSGGTLPVLNLTQTGLKALEARAALPIPVVGLTLAPNDKVDISASGTVWRTLTFFRQGLSPAQIADQRKLTETTIYSHLAQLIEQGEIALHELVPPPIEVQILAAAAKAGRERLTPIKALLPDEISYDQIKCVLAAGSQSAAAPVELAPVEKMAEPVVISQPLASPEQAPQGFDALHQWRTKEAQKNQMPPYIIFSNKVLEAIAQAAPRTLAELGAIKGVGPTKLEKYGQTVLTILKSAPETTPELTQPPPSARPEQSTQPDPGHQTPAKADDIIATILKVVADLEGLLTRQTLATLLTAGPGKVVPFSDHEARGIFYSKLDEEIVLQRLQEVIVDRKITLTTNQRLILNKK